MRRIFLSVIAGLAIIASAFSVAPAVAKEPVYQSFLGSAINGTDPVAYFTEGRPVAGSSDFTHK